MKTGGHSRVKSQGNSLANYIKYHFYQFIILIEKITHPFREIFRSKFIVRIAKTLILARDTLQNLSPTLFIPTDSSIQFLYPLYRIAISSATLLFCSTKLNPPDTVI